MLFSRLNSRLALFLACLLLSACHQSSSAAVKKVIVLGIDGMDPGFLERHWAELPNLSHLRDTGGFRRMQTTTPPQSPVAWSSVITGLDPAGHGIFDFIHRDPETLSPYSSMSETRPPDTVLPIGPWRIPLSDGHVEIFRHGEAFWEPLAEQGIPVNILRMPTNFPPVPEGRALGGMGTPDLLGTFGTYTFFTNDSSIDELVVNSGGVIVPVKVADHRVEMPITGPENTLREDGTAPILPMIAWVDPSEPVARFQVGEQDFILNQGEWSEWVPVEFPMIPGLVSSHGMIRVYAKSLGDRFQVYVSPVNLDPTQPDLPISEPPDYSAELAEEVGMYYTQGMAEDTSALREGVLSHEEYLQQSNLVSTEHLRLLHHAVDELDSGFLFFHFFGIDQNSHMLWGKYEDELLETYKLVDREVGWVSEHAPDATLIVMSDHGFGTFDRAVHLNSWLRDNGLLTMLDPAKPGEEGFENIDWSRTRAYAVGLNAIYINQYGRERNGVVEAGHRTEAVLQEIRDKLVEFRDPQTGERVVEEVYLTSSDDPAKNAPDLIVGFRPSFRASWQTTLGGTPIELIEDNLDAWIGDHCIAPQFVPGVLLSNKKLRAETPKLTDVPATVLDEFSVAPIPGSTGKSFF